jgi:hypothetical protein
MRPTRTLVHKLGFSRELDYAVITQAFVAKMASHNAACLLGLSKHLGDEMLYPMQPASSAQFTVRGDFGEIISSRHFG